MRRAGPNWCRERVAQLRCHPQHVPTCAINSIVHSCLLRSDVVVNAFMFRLQQRDAHRHAPSLESSLSGASSTFARTGTRDDVPSALASAGRALAGSVSRLLSRSGSWGSPGGRGAGRRPWVEGRSQGVTPSVHVWNSFFLTQARVGLSGWCAAVNVASRWFVNATFGIAVAAAVSHGMWCGSCHVHGHIV